LYEFYWANLSASRLCTSKFLNKKSVMPYHKLGLSTSKYINSAYP